MPWGDDPFNGKDYEKEHHHPYWDFILPILVFILFLFIGSC